MKTNSFRDLANCGASTQRRRDVGVLALTPLVVLATSVVACGGAKAPAVSPPPQTGSAAAMTPQPYRASGPVGEKASSLREAASLLDRADEQLAKGNRNLAEQYFSTAEIMVGSEGPAVLSSLASKFREGAPPRVNTPIVKVAEPTAPPQPTTVGGSEADDEADKVPVPKVETAQLSGVVNVDGKPATGAFGLVTLEPIGRKATSRSPKKRVMEQRGREFLPKLIAVPVGSTIEFPNFDQVFHNVFSTSPTAAFDLGLYRGGEAREYVFPKEGILRIGCNLHANMSAYIAVVSSPHFVITDDSGKFSFQHLQPGKYKLRAWNEKTKTPAVTEITVKAGANSYNVSVTGDAASGPQADKFGGKRG